MAATTWRPAFSMSTREGMPISSMVRRSASRICAELRTRIGRLESLGYDKAQDGHEGYYSGTTGSFASLPDLCGGSLSECDGTLGGMAATVNVNGQISDQAHAVVSVFDHGFLYGEGVYETLRTYNGRPFLFDRHMRRLRNSAGMLALPVPLTDDLIEARFQDTMRAAGIAGAPGNEAYIRLMITRGVGDLSYDPAVCSTPTVVIVVKPQVDPPVDAFERGVTVALVSIVRNHPGSVNPIIKSNNLLNNAIAMQEAVRRSAFEGLMRNYRGELAECTTSNVFLVKNGTALTPPVDAGLLAGITREFLFEVGVEQGVPVREAVLRDNDLFEADEAFLTSTTREIVPIVRVEDRLIGAGTPGPITKALLDAYRNRARALTQALPA
ncbi:MAG: branched-chain amino acid aminotransferase [Blastocatellia bacterium]|nr:MAG: branched-chain amino acid aminotransferase [Blastocatellia bacterium]